MILRTSAGFLTTFKRKTSTLPEVGNSRAEIMRNAVVFPAPFGPIRPKLSPDSTLRLKLSKARMAPKSFVRLVIPMALSKGGSLQSRTHLDFDRKTFLCGYP